MPSGGFRTSARNVAAIKPPDLRFQYGAFALYASAAMLCKVTTNTPTYKVALISPLRNGIVLSPNISATSTSLRLGWELKKEKNKTAK
jgi:hypothetical protein